MDKFDLLLSDLGAEVKGIWAYMPQVIEAPFSSQHFQIHISAYVDNSIGVFKTIIPYLFKNNLPFKVISTQSNLMKLNQGEFGRSQIGKFITIYPTCDIWMHLEKLAKLSAGFSGPVISSDIRYYSSLVYYRFGLVGSQSNIVAKSLNLRDVGEDYSELAV